MLEKEKGDEKIIMKISVREVKDSRGWLRKVELFVGNEIFILDKRGFEFFKSNFFNDNVVTDNEYLARYNDDGKLEYFHRMYKYFVKPYDTSAVVHHKNGKKNDNRNCNLIPVDKEEHKQYHDALIQEKIEKAQEKYRKRGEAIQRRYIKRGEAMERSRQRRYEARLMRYVNSSGKKRRYRKRW